MNTSIDQPLSASYRHGVVRVHLHSGRELNFPVHGNPRLEGKSDEQLNHIELSPFGLHWPELDEDLSLRGIAEGRYGQVTTTSTPRMTTPSVNQLKRAIAIREQIEHLQTELAHILRNAESPPAKRRRRERIVSQGSFVPVSPVKTNHSMSSKRAARILVK